jgi:hypothetical protein
MPTKKSTRSTRLNLAIHGNQTNIPAVVTPQALSGLLHVKAVELQRVKAEYRSGQKRGK